MVRNIGVGKLYAFFQPSGGPPGEESQKTADFCQKPDHVRNYWCRETLQFLFLGGVRNYRGLVRGCYCIEFPTWLENCLYVLCADRFTRGEGGWAVKKMRHALVGMTIGLSAILVSFASGPAAATIILHDEIVNSDLPAAGFHRHSRP